MRDFKRRDFAWLAISWRWEHNVAGFGEYADIPKKPYRDACEAMFPHVLQTYYMAIWELGKLGLELRGAWSPEWEYRVFADPLHNCTVRVLTRMAHHISDLELVDA